MPHPLSALQPLGRALLGLVYPDLCLGCDRRLPDAHDLPLCLTCLRGLPRPAPDAARAALAVTPARDAIGRATALWSYDAGGAVQRIQHALKYAGRPHLGSPLGTLLADAWTRDGGTTVDVVVPVPLSRLRTLERGYNQAAALAGGVGEGLGVPVATDDLVRTRPTRSQTRLSPAQRWANVEGAFAVRQPEPWAGRHVLLVDDVLTTGATLGAAAAALAAAGARVDVAVLALADR